jgi:hypothetical protein
MEGSQAGQQEKPVRPGAGPPRKSWRGGGMVGWVAKTVYFGPIVRRCDWWEERGACAGSVTILQGLADPNRAVLYRQSRRRLPRLPSSSGSSRVATAHDSVAKPPRRRVLPNARISSKTQTGQEPAWGTAHPSLVTAGRDADFGWTALAQCTRYWIQIVRYWQRRSVWMTLMRM